jgi:hypothetical protein
MPTPPGPVPNTSVPFPTLGPAGFIIPSESQILTGRLADLNAAFGGMMNPALSTPQGQLATSDTAIIGDSFAVFSWFCNMTDPAYSVGRMQDGIGRLYFIERFPGTATIQTCALTGLNGVSMPLGALAQDQAQGLWVATGTGVFANGTLTISFASTVNGPTAAPASLTVYQGPAGWNTVAPSGPAVLGANVESPAQFEQRRALSTGLNSMGPLGAVYGAVLNVPGVLDCYVFQNITSAPLLVGGVTLAANSIYVCPLGGTSAAIAQAIFTRLMPGCNMSGNTTVTVADPNPAYLPPVPTYSVTYQTPTVLPFAVVVKMFNTGAVPSNALTLVQSAVVNAFAGLDGGPRAKIGSLVLATRYNAPVSAISNTFNGSTGQVIAGWSSNIVQIQLGVDGGGASITGSIAGSSLTVTALASGGLLTGQLLEGSGLPGGTGPVYVLSQTSGSVGGTGVYLVSGSGFTIASGTFVLSNLGNDWQTNINQAPACSAINCYLQLVSS